MIGIILLVVLCMVYVGGSIFFKKKEKPAIWNSIFFFVVTVLLALIFRNNCLLRLPDFDRYESAMSGYGKLFYASPVMLLIISIVISGVAGSYGEFMKGDKAYKWNTLFIRPLVLEIGFCGLVLPYLYSIKILGYGIGLIMIPLSLAMILVIVVQVVLNLIEKEWRMKMWLQILFDLVTISLNTALVFWTNSVWLVVIPHVVYFYFRMKSIRKITQG